MPKALIAILAGVHKLQRQNASVRQGLHTRWHKNPNLSSNVANQQALVGNHREQRAGGERGKLVGREAHRGSEDSALIVDWKKDTRLFPAVIVLLSLSYYSNTCSLSLEKISSI